MEEKRIVDYIKENLIKLRNQEFKCTEIVECRNRIANCWEQFCQRVEEANIDEEDMKRLVCVLSFLTRKYYYEAFPQWDFSSEDMNPVENQKTMDKKQYDESIDLMRIQGSLNEIPIVDEEKLDELIAKAKEKAKPVSGEKMLQAIVDAQTKDPWILEISANVSTIRKFEKLMGEYPEITEALKENEGGNNIYILG